MAVVADLVVEEVASSVLSTVKKVIGYIWYSKDNVEKLRSEKIKLENMKKTVELKIESANANGDGVQPGVKEWAEEALAHITLAEEFLQEEADAKKTCFNFWMCVNPNTLRHYGRHAAKMIPDLENKQKDGEAFKDEISVSNNPIGVLDLSPRENFDDLDTHNSVLKKIMDSVQDETTQITGIYGMGGVGKTTLAKEVAARVKDLFALVVFVIISQHVDAESIKTQVEIAAKRIKYKGEKVLIIMDDVWTGLKLHDLGIPCGKDFPSCKILLTSRSSRVCTAMDAQAIICVESLPIEEAWVLFKRVVGESVETDALKKVAEKVVIGCGGLPLILDVVGKAMKNKDEFVQWEDALVKIAKDETLDIGGALRAQFARLKLSYDYLESEQVKLVFLLCSMFPEDFNVSLERLAYYCVGLQIFTRELDSLEAARNKVKGAVNILKSSRLLLDGEDEFTTKMHDVVRDVALLIASTGDNNFLVEAGKNLTEWQPRPGSLSYTGISLMKNDIRKLPAGYELNIPLLKIFLIQRNYLLEISDEFTQAMKKVEVIDFQYNNISSLPKSLNQLTRLRMLNLGGNRRLCDVSILGELKDLEILILNETGIKKIPQEIGKLVNLRLFQAAGCPYLSHIEPGVLSELRWLEELSIEYHPTEGKDNSLVETGNVLNTGFLIDPVESPSHGSSGLTDGSTDFFAQNRLSVSRRVHGSTGRFNPSFKTLEIGGLGKLTSLNLLVPHICLIPEGDYQKRLKTFCIQIGGSEEFIDKDDIPAGDKTLTLETLDDDISHLEHVRKWIEVCNVIVLRSINNLDKLDKLMPRVYCEGFGFKTIWINKCANLLYLVDSLDEMQTSFFSSIGNHEGVKENILSEVEKLILYNLSSLKVIWNCADEYIRVNNLVTLDIWNCHKLEKLFSVSVAHGLVNLKELKIQHCNSLKEVISDGDGETSTSEIDPVVPPKNIVFRRLAKIELAFMESLTSFYPGNATIEYPSLVKVEITVCHKLEKWGYGTHDTPKLQFVKINHRKVNGSTIDETLVKYRVPIELKKKEEGPSFVYSSEGEE